MRIMVQFRTNDDEEVNFSFLQRKLQLLNENSLSAPIRTVYLLNNGTVGPLLSGHPWDFKSWLFNRGIEYCSLETLK